MSIIMILLCAGLVVSAFILLLSNKYREGIVGHVGLALVVSGCLLVLGQAVLGDVEYTVLPETVIIHVGTLLILIHLSVRYVFRCQASGTRQGEKPSDKILDILCRHF